MEAKYDLRNGENDAKEILVLNRLIRYTSISLEYEADL